MAIQTGGYRLSTMPRVNVDFRVRPIDLSGLGAGFRGGMQQITAGIKERREKDRQGRIRLAALGDPDAMASLSDADKGYAQEMAIEIERKRLQNELFEAQIAEAKEAIGEKGRQRAVEEKTERDTGRVGISEKTGRIDFVPFDYGQTMTEGTEEEKRIAGETLEGIAKRGLTEFERRKKNEEATRRADEARRKMETEDLSERITFDENDEPILPPDAEGTYVTDRDTGEQVQVTPPVDEATKREAIRLAKIRKNELERSEIMLKGAKGELTDAERKRLKDIEEEEYEDALERVLLDWDRVEEYAGKDFYPKLLTEVEYRKGTKEKYKERNIRGSKFVQLIDQQTGQAVATISKDRQEVLLESLSPEKEAEVRAWLADQMMVTKPITRQVGDLKVDLTPEQADAFDDFSLKLEGKLSPGEGWKNFAIIDNAFNWRDSEKDKERKRIKFLNIVKSASPEALRSLDLTLARLLAEENPHDKRIRDAKGQLVLDEQGKPKEKKKSMADDFDELYGAGSADFFIDISKKK
jgi:hypothetical protein